MNTNEQSEILRLTFRKPPFWSGSIMLVIGVCVMALLSIIRDSAPAPREILVGGALLAIAGSVLAFRKLRLPKIVPPIELGVTRFVMPASADSRRIVELDYGDLRALSLRQRGAQQVLVVETTRGLFMFPAGAFEDPSAIERFLVGLRERLAALPNGSDVLEGMSRREELIRKVLAVRPTVTYVILGTLLAGLAAQVFSGAFFEDGDTLKMSALGANVPDLVRAGEWWRLITASFLHGSFLHVFINGLSLIVVGQIVERVIGPWRLAIVYIVACVGGALASSIAARAGASVGASTGIFGLLGALAVCNWHYRRELALGFKQPLELWLFNLLLNGALPLFFPLIDIWGHVGGLVAGAVMTYALVAPYKQLVYQRPSGSVLKGLTVAMCVVVLGAVGLAVANATTTNEAHVLTIAKNSTNGNWMNMVAWEIARKADASPQLITEATETARRAIELETDSGSRGAARDTYATLLYRAGRLDDALDSEDLSLRETSAVADAFGVPHDEIAAQLARFLDARMKRNGVRESGVKASAVTIDMVGQGMRVRLSEPLPKGVVVYAILRRGSAREGLLRLTLGSERTAEREHTIPLSSAIVRGADRFRSPSELDVMIGWVDAEDCRCSASAYEVRLWPHDSTVDAYP